MIRNEKFYCFKDHDTKLPLSFVTPGKQNMHMSNTVDRKGRNWAGSATETVQV